MRLSTVFVSSAFVLAGLSAALPIDREDMLVARFADSDFLDEIEARAYDEELELYARGGALSKISGGKKKDNPPSYQSASRDRPPAYQPSPNHPPPLPDFRRETDYSHNHKSPTGHNRRSYYAADDNELVARGNFPSKGTHVHGDKERKDGSPPKYKVAAKDPPPRYEPSEHYPPPLGPFLTDHHSVHSGHHRRSFYDLD